MDKQKISKILIITSIATGVTLSGAFLIYKHNKENKQYKRNSHSNFSITIHLSKDQVHDREEKEKEKNNKVIVEGEEAQDLEDYIDSLPTREEKNFFLNLFDKFINIFSKKEDFSEDNGTVIITKPNEATISSIDSNVEIDDNNDTVIITKPNEAITNNNTTAPVTSTSTANNTITSPSLEGPISDIKVLNDVIEQTIHLMNSSGNESDSSIHSHISSNSSIRRNFGRKIIITPTSQHSNNSSNPNSNRNSISGASNGPLSAQSSTSTLIEKRDSTDDLRNTTTASYDDYFSLSLISNTNSNSNSNTTNTTDMIHHVVDDEAHDADAEEEEEEILKYSTPNTPAASRKRTETITNFNANKRNEDHLDSESENNAAPSTPKMNFADHRTFSPILNNHHTPQSGATASSTINHKTDNDSINPLSIDINKILMTPNFEFSDEDDGANPMEDLLSKNQSLHRSSSMSSTTTFQSAHSSWTDGQSQEEPPLESKDAINDETWEVQSACSSTSGFYSAQEEFFD